LEDNDLSLPHTADTPANLTDAPVSARKTPTSDALLAAVLKSLDEDKAEDVVTIALKGCDHGKAC